MIFMNREDAGRQLARRLEAYANRRDAIVLGIPRGGVTVAFEVARALHLPLDIFLSRKLGVPGQEELAFGAIAAGDGRFLDQQVIRAAGISPQEIERVTQEVTETLQQRAFLYRGNRHPLQVKDRTVILVDDGIATGASIYAAINALQHMRVEKLVVAVPVAPASTCAWLRTQVDQLICLYEPEEFNAVGQFYRSFSQVSDKKVTDLLRRAEQFSSYTASASTPTRVGAEREVSIDLHNVRLEGTLSLPQDPKGIVLFAHGSGSSRHSPRNRYVAEELHSHGIATLLFDLLAREEELADRQSAELRFDIGLLAERLLAVTRWVSQQPATRDLPVGYFGASTGAAAALVAAAQLPELIAAVVSRGGRPDLAGQALGMVRAPVLLIVGGNDEMVISLNRQVYSRLKCSDKRLVIIPGATHLFEESGALEQVARVAADWFAHYLVSFDCSPQSSALCTHCSRLW
jgi:putative phosphoribosyl transferase